MNFLKPDPFALKLDPYERALEDKFAHLDEEGLLVANKLTVDEKRKLQQSASLTLQKLRNRKKHVGTNPSKQHVATVTRSVSMPRNIWDALDSKRGALSRGKFIAAFVS